MVGQEHGAPGGRHEGGLDGGLRAVRGGQAPGDREAVDPQERDVHEDRAQVVKRRAADGGQRPVPDTSPDEVDRELLAGGQQGRDRQAVGDHRQLATGGQQLGQAVRGGAGVQRDGPLLAHATHTRPPSRQGRL